jgi:succinate dehydrogenase/fumarate reductase-like Fe-S protein
MCSLTCPKGLDPRKALEHLKQLYVEYKDRKEAEIVTI